MPKALVPKIAVQPNQGVVRAFAKALRRMMEDYNRDFIKRCLEGYVDFTEGHDFAKAQDAQASPNQLALQQAAAIARAAISNEEDTPAREISYRFVRDLLRHLSTAQRRSLERAGVSKALLKQRFSVPVLRGQFIAPSTAQKIPTYVEWSTKLISHMRTQSRLKIQNILAEALERGKPLSELTRDIKKAGRMDSARAFRVALDQSCKLNNYIQLENCKALGITEGIWVHVPGMYTSRDTHKAMDGQRFDLLTGMYDPAVGTHVHPGELPFCRCVYRPVLPESIMETPPK